MNSETPQSDRCKAIDLRLTAYVLNDLDADQMATALDLVKKYGVKVPCITRHNFVGLLVGEVEVGDANHQKHIGDV